MEATASDITPPGMCLPESLCLPPGRSQGGTAGCGIAHRTRGLWSIHNHHPPTQGAAGWGGRAASLGSSRQDPYPSPSCIPHWHGEPQPPQHTTASPSPAACSPGQAPGNPAGAKGMLEEGRGVRAGACMCARQGEGSRAVSAGGVVSARHRLTGKGCRSRRKLNCSTTVTIAVSGSLQSDSACWGGRGQSVPKG